MRKYQLTQRMAALPATVTRSFNSMTPPLPRVAKLDGGTAPRLRRRHALPLFRRQPAKRRSRSELLTTVTELAAIAALAKTGESRIPKNGYSTPAASGMPNRL